VEGLGYCKREIYPRCSDQDEIVSTPSFDDSSIPFRRPTTDLKPAFDLEPQHEFAPSRTTRKRGVDFGGEGPTKLRSVTKRTKALSVSDPKQLWLFYEQRFKNCQQAACKLIAKAWIKTVEPKKQSTHPYTGKDEKAPDWWPQPWGDGQENKVRHKEPDHLYKRGTQHLRKHHCYRFILISPSERLYLLGHILRMVVEPNERQHSDIKKLQLNVAKLEEVTYEALSAWFADANNPSNFQKKAYLEEIFKVAKQEERFRDGRIGESTGGGLLQTSTCSHKLQTQPSRSMSGQTTESLMVTLRRLRTIVPRDSMKHTNACPSQEETPLPEGLPRT
jgi:hypothetical protein